MRKKVRNLKEEMRDRFGAKHALKSPAHITLIPPFKREEANERFISDFLSRFAIEQEAFSLILDGFGCFSPGVIYINVKDGEPIRKLHSKLCSGLNDEYLAAEEELNSRFNPHMTIATRDLDWEQFKLAWPEYKNRMFNAEFIVKSVFILKHNGKFWDIYREFEFGK